MHFSFLFIGWEPTTWPTNNGVLVRNFNHVQKKLQVASPSFEQDVGSKWKQAWSSNEIMFRNVVTCQPWALGNKWSAHHRQVTIFCSTSSNMYFLYFHRLIEHFAATSNLRGCPPEKNSRARCFQEKIIVK